MACRQGYSLFKKMQRRNVRLDLWRTLRLCFIDSTAPVRGIWCGVVGHDRAINEFEYTSNGHPVWCRRCSKSLGYTKGAE